MINSIRRGVAIDKLRKMAENGEGYGIRINLLIRKSHAPANNARSRYFIDNEYLPHIFIAAYSLSLLCIRAI